MTIDDMIQKCKEPSNVEEEPCMFGRKLILHQKEESGFIHFFPLFPGINFAYIKIDASSWPAPDLFSQVKKGPLLINYCISGRCELLLNTDNYVYVTSGELSLTESFATNQYLYPGKTYEGMEFFIDLDTASREGKRLLSEFGLNLPSLVDRYCPSDSTYIACASQETDLIFRKLWSLYDPEHPQTVSQIKLYAMVLFSVLLNKAQIPPEQHHTFYTRYQVEIAKKAEQILIADLSQHHSAQELASLFSISETSLKNYFRGVFGENISSYMQKKRMEKAQELLFSTTLSVAEIAMLTGYSSQSKFAAVFRKHTGMAPLVYRRQKHLDMLKK